MRLGLFGGTFDPVHIGHLLLAEQCREQCALDQVWFVPSGRPPHKNQDKLTSVKSRLDMLELATAGFGAFVVSHLELEREGPTYTVDTLQQLQDEDASRELFFMIGTDSLADLPNWHNPSRIAQLATIVVADRGNQTIPDLHSFGPQLEADLLSKIQFVTMPGIDLSATDIRRRICEGKSIRFMVNRAVEVYIAEHQLYG